MNCTNVTGRFKIAMLEWVMSQKKSLYSSGATDWIRCANISGIYCKQDPSYYKEDNLWSDHPKQHQWSCKVYLSKNHDI